jgi:hypothetical protein
MMPNKTPEPTAGLPCHSVGAEADMSRRSFRAEVDRFHRSASAKLDGADSFTVAVKVTSGRRLSFPR